MISYALGLALTYCFASAPAYTQTFCFTCCYQLDSLQPLDTIYIYLNLAIARASTELCTDNNKHLLTYSYFGGTTITIYLYSPYLALLYVRPRNAPNLEHWIMIGWMDGRAPDSIVLRASNRAEHRCTGLIHN